MSGRNKHQVVDRKCNKCKSDVHVNEKVVECVACNLPFHIECVGIDRTKYNKIINNPDWSCSSKCKKTHEKHVETINADLPDNPTIRDVMRELRDIKNSQSFLSNKYDDLTSKMDDIMSKFVGMEDRITQLEKENASLTSQINKQNFQKGKAEQGDFNSNAIVTGVSNDFEDVSGAFKKIAAVVDGTFDVPSNVVSIERLFKPKLTVNAGNGHDTKQSDKIPILVKFSSESSKASFMLSAKKKKKINVWLWQPNVD